MSQLFRQRWTLAIMILLAASLPLAGCSDDEGSPTGPPNDDPLPPNTPAIPTVGNPQDELPAHSEFLTTEHAALGTFSPALAGLSQEMSDRLNEAQTLEFRLPASRNVIFQDGRACYPEHLQTRRENATWVGLTRTTVVEPFVELGQSGSSYYYLATTPMIWAFADVNCRNFGGHLAAITSPAEGSFVHQAVTNHTPELNYWIGLTDWGRPNDDWVWTSGEPVDWTNWNAGEPNNYGGEQFTRVRADGSWTDDEYQAYYPSVMELSEALPDFGDEVLPCAAYGQNLLFLDRLAVPIVTPHVERQVYWEKVFQVTLGTGATYSEEHSYTHGTEETTAMSFGWSIGVSAELSWGPASVAIESEFHQDFEHSVTVSSEETFTKTYEASAPGGKTMVLALWQLRERFVITDGAGEEWSDPGFILDGPLPVMEQGLKQEYLQTILFDQ